MNEPVLDLGSLCKALASLEGAIEIVSASAWFDRQPANLQNTLIAGVVQNFEFVYELSIKMLRRRIEMDSSSPAEIDAASFKDLLRIAGEKGLIADVEAWFRYRRMRTLTSHTYDREKAMAIYRDTPAFIGDARALLAALEARNG
nr:nucleotidyltransferase substrate binding protein [uncultured Rhodopila sp.]